MFLIHPKYYLRLCLAPAQLSSRALYQVQGNACSIPLVRRRKKPRGAYLQSSGYLSTSVLKRGGVRFQYKVPCIRAEATCVRLWRSEMLGPMIATRSREWSVISGDESQCWATGFPWPKRVGLTCTMSPGCFICCPFPNGWEWLRKRYKFRGFTSF